MVRPRRGKIVRLAPPPRERIRKHIEAVITFTTPQWLGVEVPEETWRFRAGTGLLLRRAALLEVDGQLIAPNAAIAGIYPPETQSQEYAAYALDRLLRSPAQPDGEDSR
jgi:hypothetical protein